MEAKVEYYTCRGTLWCLTNTPSVFQYFGWQALGIFMVVCFVLCLGVPRRCLRLLADDLLLLLFLWLRRFLQALCFFCSGSPFFLSCVYVYCIVDLFELVFMYYCCTAGYRCSVLGRCVGRSLIVFDISFQLHHFLEPDIMHDVTIWCQKMRHCWRINWRYKNTVIHHNWNESQVNEHTWLKCGLDGGWRSLKSGTDFTGAPVSCSRTCSNLTTSWQPKNSRPNHMIHLNNWCVNKNWTTTWCCDLCCVSLITLHTWCLFYCTCYYKIIQHIHYAAPYETFSINTFSPSETATVVEVIIAMSEKFLLRACAIHTSWKSLLWWRTLASLWWLCLVCWATRCAAWDDSITLIEDHKILFPCEEVLCRPQFL